MGAGIIRRTLKNRRARRVNWQANQPQPNSNILIVAATAVTTTLTMTFDQVVSLDGIPQFTTDVSGPTPVSAVQQGPNIVAITFSASIAAATFINLPYRDPAIRNASGGYVTSNQFPV